MIPKIPLYLLLIIALLRGISSTRNLNDLYNRVNHKALESDHETPDGRNFKRMDFALGWSLLDMWMNESDESKLIDHENRLFQYASSCSGQMLYEVFSSYAPSKLWGQSEDSDISLMKRRVRDTRSELEALESATSLNLYHLNAYQDRWLRVLRFLQTFAVEPIRESESKDEEARNALLQLVFDLVNSEANQVERKNVELEKSIQHLQWSEGLERLELIALCHGMFREAVQKTRFAREFEPARQRMSLLGRRLERLEYDLRLVMDIASRRKTQS